jgi:dinuclear metal center YbgI/SA1388 family protein
LKREISKIYTLLDGVAPFETAEKWDNVGLQIGNLGDKFLKLYISLDVDIELLEMVEKGSLIITHHPLIFGGLKSLDFSRYPSNLIQKMIQKDLKLLSLHTNFDKSVLNRYVFEKVLSFQTLRESDFVLYGEFSGGLESLVSHLKNSLSLKTVRTSSKIPEKESYRVALTTGSGMSLLNSLNSVDIFLTGDVKYHDIMEANSLGIGVIDIGHYESEIFFSKALQEILDSLGIESIIADSKNPFKTV